MQTDVIGAGGDNFERDPSPVESYVRLDTIATDEMEESEGEYEAWGGFESSAHRVRHNQCQSMLNSAIQPCRQSAQKVALRRCH